MNIVSVLKTMVSTPGYFIGGQAVIEGVMFRSPSAYAVAVRKPDGTIEEKSEIKHSITKRVPWKWPFLRGVATLFETLSLGVKTLEYSAEVAVPEEEREKARNKGKNKTASRFQMTLTILFALAMGLFLFVGIPYLVTSLLKGPLGIAGESHVLFHVIDGALRITMFLLYLIVISAMKDVRRLFAYHGAEHKVINTYEHNVVPTLESTRKFSRFHPRCGTSFIVVLLIVLIIIHSITFLFVPENFSYILKFVIRLVLLVPIAGVAYELIRLGSKLPDNPVVNFFLLPGILTQFFTTREPTDDMIEVSLTSFDRVQELESEATSRID
ncbi:MAG: DUF1385 domain-containing protein [Candidatus Coatesbacteria bacterium]|nr:MAG: DUF1385 domain-containing protein [Candidatus Coatesbacteria bacterium]